VDARHEHAIPRPDLEVPAAEQVAASAGPVPASGRGMSLPDTDVVATAAEAARGAHPPLVVLEPLADFLDQHGIGDGVPSVEAIGDGHSNVTLLVARGGALVVLRRPPRPPLPPSAHNVIREAKLQQALARVGAPVPQVLAVCEDESVIGAPFYLMEYRRGHVSGTELPPELDTPEGRHAVSAAVVDTLVDLHQLAFQGAGLARFGQADGYIDRQLDRFAKLWVTNHTRSVPEVETVYAWLVDHRPRERPPTLVHGDFRLGNVMFEVESPARVAAVLDWELATIGDPLSDLGYLTATWAHPNDDEANPMLTLSAVTRRAGFLNAEQLQLRYSERTGTDLGDFRWYEALALWKACVFLESSYRRYLYGTTTDPYFGTLEAGVPALARAALSRTRATA
jgi:aminoglycoside phosphotransferase (APT) family kinase protein